MKCRAIATRSGEQCRRYARAAALCIQHYAKKGRDDQIRWVARLRYWVMVAASAEDRFA
jgi:hypothetical protein